MTDHALKVITAADLAELEARGIVREVVNGQSVEQSEGEMTGKLHGRIEARLIYLLMQFIELLQLGYVYSGDTTYVLERTPEQIILVRMPDASFVRAGREDDTDPDAPHYLAPDLAIEIISPSERYGEIRAKLNDYIKAGVRQIWQ